MKSLFVICFLSLAILSHTEAQNTETVFHSGFEEAAFLSNDPLQLLIAANPHADTNKYSAYLQELDLIAGKLLKKQGKLTDEELLKKLFYKIHQKKLKWYENYVTMSDLLEKGSYDCLTGTALYAVLLNELQIPYTIYEFDFHVLLVAHLKEKDILFESTDPYGGFMNQKGAIDSHLKNYLSEKANEVGRKTVIGNRATVTHGSVVNERINLQQLVGLQYYNLAINLYNQGKLYEGRKYIDKAFELYPSTRITDTRGYFYATMPVTFMKR